MVTPSPVYLFKQLKHGTQNIKNDCHQRLSDTKFDFGWNSAQTPLGELTALPQTPSWFKAAYF